VRREANDIDEVVTAPLLHSRIKMTHTRVKEEEDVIELLANPFSLVDHHGPEHLREDFVEHISIHDTIVAGEEYHVIACVEGVVFEKGLVRDEYWGFAMISISRCDCDSSDSGDDNRFRHCWCGFIINRNQDSGGRVRVEEG
jgi:hypothetical protein